MKTMKLLPFLLVLCCLTAQAQDDSFPRKPKNMTAIIGAFADEIDVIKNEMEDRHEERLEGLTFFEGKLKGRKIVAVLSGIGKVNAAVTTAILLEHYRPREVLFTGIAGGLDPAAQPGDIIVATRIVHHDFGRRDHTGMVVRPTRNPYTLTENPQYFPVDSSLLLLAGMVAPRIALEKVGAYQPVIRTGTIATGDVFMSSDSAAKEVRAKLGADAVEMEGAAVGQVCYQQKVPFLIIRSLSDNANHSASVDMSTYGPIAARNSAALVKALLERLK
ncbi:adenosylhomocysteine nucleosidase [Siphonobacter aquaeclarae]|uniref:adenosylhomocysteine nucleosidase n=2 Tax=Siphonobacter aquaeclarae TaxID=563176 RepID=A0A1G9TD37_9BACT|nr:adenosylhomocysteine nucleosidase [Siphonobacter aquaeclarae]